MKKILLTLLLVGSVFSLMAQADYTPIKVETKKKPKDRKWSVRDTRIMNNIHGYVPVESIDNTNCYGSDCSKRYDSTGFYHVVKDGDRWWLVDPDGYRNFNRAVVNVSKGRGETNKAAFSRKFLNNNAVWINQTAEILFSLNFNGAGAWSSDKHIRAYNDANKGSKQLSYCILLNFMSSYGRKRGGTYSRPGNTGYPNQCIFVFDKAFEEFCDEHAKRVLQYKDDPNLLGYYSDNEMPVDDRNLEGYLDLPKHEEGRQAAEKWLAERGVTRDQITDELKKEFAGVVAERYYSIVGAAIRRYDPNHMYMGSRLHGRPKKMRGVIEAAGRHCDVISINYYDHWSVSQQYVKDWAEWGGKPFIVTEFYTKGMDSGLANTSGAGWVVKTQEDRGHAFQHFTLGLIEAGNCVGWQWFRYLDNDPTTRNVDASNTDSNKGLVDNNYDVYVELAEAMKQINTNVYSLAKFFDEKRKQSK